MKSKVIGITIRIFTVTLITISIFLVTGEWALRSFTFYGIEYFIQLASDGNVVLKNENLPYMPVDLANAIGNLNERVVMNPKDTYKIIILGDSIAAGGELRRGEESFSARLKVLLEKDFPGKNIDIFVFAQGGYSTTEEVEGYRRYSKYFKPDLVILSYCHNDTAEADKRIITRNGKKLIAFYKTGNPYLKIFPFNRFLTERFLIARFMNEKSIELLSVFHIRPGIAFCNLAEQKIFRGFEKLYVLTKNTNTPVVVVVFPYLGDEIDITRDRMADFIKQWCARFNFLHIDLLSKFAEYDYRQLRCNPQDSCHPNAIGHKIAAETIEEMIKQADLIK
ncbi:SGNH/GDSL hydrolase family protein [bacterium]|nr:SGNH/GDSL hydrolase family protein [bacterium]